MSQSKPLTIRQHALASALQDATGSRSPSPEPLTHVQEQSKLREETIAAFHTAVDEDGDEDDLLVLREKTKDELEKEEEEYRAYLQREVGEDLSGLITVETEGTELGADAADAQEGSPKKKRKKEKKEKPGKSKQDEDQEFLMKSGPLSFHAAHMY